MSNETEDIIEWIRRFTPQLLGVARAFADDAEEAEDLLQELWMVAYRQMDRRPANAPPGAWLHAILLNIGRGRWRRRRRRERLMVLWGRHHVEEATRQEPAAELEGTALWRDVAALPDLQRRVLLMRVVDELSTAQVAAELGRAEGTVKASLHRAMAALRGRWHPASESSVPRTPMVHAAPGESHDDG